MSDLFNVFLKQKPPVPEVPEKKIKIRPERTIGDVSVIAEVQTLLNPNLAPIKAPTPVQTMNKGLAPAMDNTGSWGKGGN